MFRHLMLLLCTCLPFGRTAVADVIFFVDMDQATSGIQTSVNVNQGNTFFVDLYMQVTSPTVLSSYFVGVYYDTAELNGVSSTQVRPDSWDGFGNATVNDSIAGTNATIGAPLGQFAPFAGANLNNDANANIDTSFNISAPFSQRIGTLRFTAAGAANADSLIDVLPVFRGLSDGLIGNDGITQLPNDIASFIGGSVNITAVPEPTSVLSGLVIGGIGLLRLRRKK